jgi:hypothetical protein
MKTKFENIKGMLCREEMKQVVGGDVYNGHNKSGGAAATPASGTALGGQGSGGKGYSDGSGSYPGSFPDSLILPSNPNETNNNTANSYINWYAKP